MSKGKKTISDISKEIKDIRKKIRLINQSVDEMKTGLDELFSELPRIASKHDMTSEEYMEWIKKNNPEFDWGYDVGNEVIDYDE